MFKSLALRAGLSLVLFIVVVAAVPLGVAIVQQGRPGGWTKYANNPVFDVGAANSWDDIDVFRPSVLFDGTTYHMWYTGDRGGTPRLIGYATSPDGLTWTRYANNPVVNAGPVGSWDARGARFAEVISDGGVFKMWYTGFDAAGKNQIGYATSPDGIAWTKSENNPVLELGTAGTWDEMAIHDPTVVKDGSTYKMWYAASGATGNNDIGYATSPDGINWTKYSGSPVLSSSPAWMWDYAIYGPHVMFDGVTYHMWYSGCNFANTACEIGYASSKDGIHWAKQGRVLRQGPDGSFDRLSADYPTVIQVDNTYKMWYSGVDDTKYYYHLGYASAPVLSKSVFVPLTVKNSTGCDPLWFDPFTDYHSGWTVADSQNVKFAYTGGEYQILVKSADSSYWGTPGVQMTDGVITVSVRFASTGDNSDNAGIVFGKSPDGQDNFYRFMIRRDSGYCIQRSDQNSGWTDLQCGTAASYLPYPAANHLKVVRNGAAIAGYANGQLVGSVTDSTYLGSLRVGLDAGTSAGNADLRFDNYGIYPLSCSDKVSTNAGQSK